MNFLCPYLCYQLYLVRYNKKEMSLGKRLLQSEMKQIKREFSQKSKLAGLKDALKSQWRQILEENIKSGQGGGSDHQATC